MTERRKPVRRKTIPSIAIALALGSGVLPAQSETTALTSPMVDTGLYRAGEVKRLNGAYGDWRVVCDEIAKLKQRYCSLNTVVLSADRRIVGRLDMSTGDNGQPAALLHLPLGIVLRAGVDVSVADDKPFQKGESQRGLPILTCDGQECLALWTPSIAEIGRLQKAKALSVQYTIQQIAGDDPFALNPISVQTTIKGRISPTGFAAAIEGSLH